MIIPKSFELYGQTINVHFVEDLGDKYQLQGVAHLNRNEIELKPPCQTKDGIQIVEICFFHELIHLILDKMGEHELNQNERFVDTMAQLLHQALKTGGVC